MDAAQTVTAYKDGTPAVINNSFLERGNIDPKSAIVEDDPKAEAAKPFINAFVTTEEKKDDEDLKKLVEVWHSKDVQDALNEQSKGTSVQVQMGPEELAKVLKDTEDQIKK